MNAINTQIAEYRFDKEKNLNPKTRKLHIHIRLEQKNVELNKNLNQISCKTKVLIPCGVRH